LSGEGEVAAHVALDPEPAAASRAREFVRETLRSWELAGREADTGRLTDDAVLMVSELVANAVQHTGTPLDVTCKLAGDVIEVAVADRHPARVLPDPPASGNHSAERGRGLLLPSALAASWGVTYTAAAKTVWFRLRINRSAAAAAEGGGAPPGAPGKHRELGKLHFDELMRHTVEAARDAVGADAAYALVADEEGELRVRGAVGVTVPAALAVPAGTVILANGGTARSQLSVPFLVDGRVTGVLGVAAAAPARFAGADEVRLQQVADQVAMSLERLRLSELERVRRGRIAFLAEASELLSSTLDQRQAMSLTAQLMVPRLAAWCAVFLADDAGTPRPAYVWHADESRLDALSRLLDAIPPPALPAPGPAGSGAQQAAHSWSLALPASAARDEAAGLADDSAWCFPLTARGRRLGVVVIGRPRGDAKWQDPPPRESIELAEDLVRRAALALDNSWLYERQRMTSHALQRSLLPPELPRIPRVELAAAYEAAGEANEVGGDFYDVFGAGEEAGRQRWRFAIGDVCGTGPEAAAVTGLARHTLRILAAEGRGIADVVSRLNELVLQEGPRTRFITLLHGEIAVPPAGTELPPRVSLVCAGHPLPLLLRAGDQAPPRPAAEPQLLLGVKSQLSFGTQDLELFPGDVLLCVTDGVTERRDDGGRLLDDDDGLAQLLADCRGLSASAVAARVRRAVGDFGSDPPSDDMAVLALRAI
jgi:serine phosphatase RsbU (regulator of sigma subunit)/anti-sigma regulatory factor (Ser/Thr protein kinase)